MEANMELAIPVTERAFQFHVPVASLGTGEPRRFLGQAPQRHHSRPAQTQTNAARPTSEFDRLHRSLPPLPLAAGAPRRHDRERIRHHHHVTKVGYRNRRRIEYPPRIIVPTSPCSFCASTSPPNPSQRDEAGGRSLQRRRRSHPPGAAGGTPTLPPPRRSPQV
ncbi:hypothetical protein GQ55_1G368700 [Panicum hallii var. hallii]|uniref:Uncharacterized protein n=1 Tax=Panicum hallii var. hallii TaxID=1504633 RepID=A0A2T7FBG7_9POAL|nr:hypothetical protein GQ55_1G368700 [Panicum hallii var. hallii]